MSHDAEKDVAAADARIAAGRSAHGVGASEDFPGNVCHLVSPIVGTMRLRVSRGEPLRDGDVEHFIDRLSLVLDMARVEAEREVARVIPPASTGRSQA